MMKGYSPRKVLRKSLEIFRATGKPMKLWIRNSAAILDSATYAPGNLFSNASDPIESDTNYTTRFIFGKFEEADAVTFDGPGRRRAVSGVIVVPMLYKQLLSACEYVDPYLDGSRFVKLGAIIDESRLFCTLNIRSMSLQNPSEVV